jgi:hypothetical protein
MAVSNTLAYFNNYDIKFFIVQAPGPKLDQYHKTVMCEIEQHVYHILIVDKHIRLSKQIVNNTTYDTLSFQVTHYY